MNRLATFLCLASIAGCAVSSDSGDATSSDAELRKRVNPNSGSAAFELKKPAWHTNAFLSGFSLSGQALSFGIFERAPGSYDLRSQTYSASTLSMPVPLERGFITVFEPAGITVRYSRPVADGANRVLVLRGAKESVIDGSRAYSLLTFDGSFSVATSASEKQTFTLAEGQLKEIVLPTATLKFAFETIDPEFPGTAGCLSVRPSFNNPAVPHTQHGLLSVARGASYVLPAGQFASLYVDACGVRENPKLAPDAALTIEVHRLEINDVDVVSPDGTHKLVRGSFVVERKLPDGTYTQVTSGTTHTGVDLTDGTYRVTSRAANAPPHVVEVTF